MTHLFYSLWHLGWALGTALWYKHPSDELVVIGVTGTKGKSTTLELLHAIFMRAGKKTALLSSVSKKIGTRVEQNMTGNSMPGRGKIQKFLAEARDAECKIALLEVTSQGVVQHRHRGIAFDAGVVTNLHAEHIEAHGSLEAYREAKLDFFRAVLLSPKQHVMLFVNRDDPNVACFGELSLAQTTWYSKEEEEVPRTLFAEFNQENYAAATAVASALGVEGRVIASALLEFKGVPGRLELVQEKPFSVVVDYAHTPDSLDKVLRLLKTRARSLVLVFGSAGGGRDVWKRPELAKVAARHVRYAIVTNEDPYDEDPMRIIHDVARGFEEVCFVQYEKEVDRKRAIKRACALAEEGDMVVLAGKGSEASIHREGGKEEQWSDVAAAQEILKECDAGYTKAYAL